MKKLLLPILFGSYLQVSSQAYTAGTPYSNYHDIVPDSLLTYQYYPSVYRTYSLNIFGSTGPELEFTSIGSVSSGGSQAQIKIRTINPDVSIRFGRWDSVWVPGSQSWYVTKVAKALLSGEQINAANAI